MKPTHLDTSGLCCHGIAKTYGNGNLAQTVLKNIDLTLPAGCAAALLGPSGSGKTTLLSILGCLLNPSAGELSIGGESVPFANAAQLCGVRRRKIGFIFQHAQLLPFLTAEENLILTAVNAGQSARDAKTRAADLLERLNVANGGRNKPAQLSGGQAQRVAVARALMTRPSLILADEPTAALDWEHGQKVMTLLLEQAREQGAALLTVTHDTRLIPFHDRSYRIDAGHLTETTNHHFLSSEP